MLEKIRECEYISEYFVQKYLAQPGQEVLGNALRYYYCILLPRVAASTVSALPVVLGGTVGPHGAEGIGRVLCFRPCPWSQLGPCDLPVPVSDDVAWVGVVGEEGVVLGDDEAGLLRYDVIGLYGEVWKEEGDDLFPFPQR